MLHRCPFASVVVFAAILSAPAGASPGAYSEDCIELGSDLSLRHNGAQFLLLRDGTEHYRLAFRDGNCNAMTLTSKLSLVTGEHSDRVCAGSTKLKAKGRSCLVSRVEKISGDDFARHLRRR
jgi:hypothetical protein